MTIDKEWILKCCRTNGLLVKGIEWFTLEIAIKISIYEEMEQMIILKNRYSQTTQNPTERV
ncbi:hypothetical protein ACZ11_23890 [Lysinibacillus xylanilyticus]|uniref:Uncharacterized protein n=1 Tax=Lysinibacillus xylanilyticus TaxID=582475 RepID=A0A0K9F216_9BACI|nr:hypothetical protein ACZ11_23890 [Lysinibacillus xylanilyticus]